MDGIDSGNALTLHVPCRYGFLRVVRQAVFEQCLRLGLSEYKASQMEMAVDEACSNIIEHSCGGEATDDQPKPGLQVVLRGVGDGVEIRIFDFGSGFAFEQARAIPPEEYLLQGRARGLGLYIIRNFVDECEYQRNQASGNCLRLVKRL